MVALMTRMQIHLRNWRHDLEPAWQEFFIDCPPPNFDAVPVAQQIADDAHLWPDRRGVQVANAPVASHICRAFDGIQPTNVRVVVLGQDPYPSRAQATGRAFEDGNWNGDTRDLARSLKPMMLAAMATQENHRNLFCAGMWPEVRRQIEDRRVEFPALGNYFDMLAGQGVLFINAAWTHTRPGDVDIHLALWEPIVHYLLQKLAADAQNPIVFLLLGNKAQTVFAVSEAEGNHVARVDLPHPSRAAGFFQQNPWLCVNESLGAAPIVWW